MNTFQNNNSSLTIKEIGVVTAVYDEILRVEGFPSISEGEILETDTNERALVLGFDHDKVYAAVLGDWEGFVSGVRLRRTGRFFSAPVGVGLLGRVVNVFGKPLDNKGDIDVTEFRNAEQEAPSIITRESVHDPLSTGLLAVDATIPLGRGQRELIVGDRKSGKTTIALETIIHQRSAWWEGLHDKTGQKPVHCIYVSIGQKQSDIAGIIRTLEEHHAMEYTIMVVASASNPAIENYLAAYVGCTMGEYFRDKGEDALVIYDDLTKHAWAYRNLSLLLGRPPGREAYPGDIFYIHAKLLERAAKMNKTSGGGSLTALPVIETVEGDITAYIPTNLISITDGQIYLSSDLFHKGQRPAVNIGLSVSRVGSAAQIPAIKKLTGRLKLDLSQAAELRKVAEVSPQSLSSEAKKTLQAGDRILSVLRQPQHVLYALSEQACIWEILFSGKIDDVPASELPVFFEKFMDYMRETNAKTLAEIESGEWTDDLAKKIIECSQTFRQIRTV